MELLDALTTTRAIRRYAQEPISEHDLNRILFAATRAPSGSNRQPCRFVVLRSESTAPSAVRARQILGEAFRSMWAAKEAGDGYRSGTGTDPASPKSRMAATMRHFVDHIEFAPAIIFPCYQRWREPDPSEGASIYPACQNLLLAARDLGYGGVMTVWHRPVETALRTALHMPDDVVIAATIPLGRPLGRHGTVRRRPLAEVVFEDRWKHTATWAADPPGTRVTAGRPA